MLRFTTQIVFQFLHYNICFPNKKCSLKKKLNLKNEFYVFLEGLNPYVFEYLKSVKRESFDVHISVKITYTFEQYPKYMNIKSNLNLSDLEI